MGRKIANKPWNFKRSCCWRPSQLGLFGLEILIVIYTTGIRGFRQWYSWYPVLRIWFINSIQNISVVSWGARLKVRSKSAFSSLSTTCAHWLTSSRGRKVVTPKWERAVCPCMIHITALMFTDCYMAHWTSEVALQMSLGISAVSFFFSYFLCML